MYLLRDCKNKRVLYLKSNVNYNDNTLDMSPIAIPCWTSLNSRDRGQTGIIQILQKWTKKENQKHQKQTDK